MSKSKPRFKKNDQSFIQWVTHGARRGGFEMEPRTMTYLLITSVALVVIATLYLMLISRTAATGRHIEHLQAELFRLQRENEQLEVTIAEESTTTRLLERANELGFIPAEQIVFID